MTPPLALIWAMASSKALCRSGKEFGPVSMPMNAILIGGPDAPVPPPPAVVLDPPVVVVDLLLELHATAASTRVLPRTISLRTISPFGMSYVSHSQRATPTRPENVSTPPSERAPAQPA